VASKIGVYRHVVTLVANQLVITDTTRAACGWKTFYDRTWSAVEAVAAGKPASNELHAAVADVLATTPIDLPEKVPFDLRQQETAQLETHTIEHLETFPDRLLHVMRVRIAEAMPHLKWSAIEALGKRAATYALSCPTHLSTAESAIHACGDGADAALVIACEERASMEDLVAASRGDKPFLKQFTKKTIYLLLPHLIRWSEWSEQWLDARCLASTDEGGDENAAEDDTPVEAPRRWRRSRLAKPCSALPIAQLKAAMVLYCCTEVETLLKNAQQTIRRKRGRDESKVAADDTWTTFAADKADFASAIFNLDSFKVAAAAKCSPTGPPRANGVSLRFGRTVWRSLRLCRGAHQPPSTPLTSCKGATNWQHRAHRWIPRQQDAASTLWAKPDATSRRPSRRCVRPSWIQDSASRFMWRACAPIRRCRLTTRSIGI
jgi:hypothetical protein